LSPVSIYTYLLTTAFNVDFAVTAGASGSSAPAQVI
jgi:hypothetical protein